ncbi:hypothetical protein GX48_06234 [Paracoccidioides brasiliensis]|nr:hypothetical protein GX48_06234 [Paracoccidioides brasiliensis]
MEGESTLLTMESDVPSSSHQVKSSRAAVRCLTCRLKHVRCDGAQPVCSTCLRKDQTCEYPTSASHPAAKPSSAKANLTGRQLAGKTRTVRACLVCRGAKRKCDGEMPERLKFLHLICTHFLRGRNMVRTVTDLDSMWALFEKRYRGELYLRIKRRNRKRPESPSDERPHKQIRISHPRVLNQSGGKQNISLPSLRKERVRSPRESPSLQLVGAISKTSSEGDESKESDEEESSSQDDEKEPNAGSVRRSIPSVQSLPVKTQGSSGHGSSEASEYVGPFTPQAHPTTAEKAQESQESSDSDVSVEMGDGAESPNSAESEQDRDDLSLFLPGLRQAVFQRTGVSRPGSTLESDRELKRLSKVANQKSEKMLFPDPVNLILPQRNAANELVSLYLTREYVNMPIFHREDFTDRYKSLWNETEQRGSRISVSGDSCIFYGILNGIFAIGTLLRDPNDLNDSEQYFQRCQNLIFMNGMEEGGIIHVQAYLIMAQYFLAANNLRDAWKSIGLAIRAAQSLHLHLVSGSHHLTPREDQELPRRVWHCSLTLECIIAMNMGITTLTKHTSETPLPFPANRDYIDRLASEGQGDPDPGIDRPSIIEFFNNSARLYHRYNALVPIMQELQLTDSGSARKKLEAFDPQPLIDVDRSLSSWQAGLPTFLRPDADSKSLKYPIARRQHNTLRIRYLHMRLLLWQPLLAIVAAASPDIDVRVVARRIASPQTRREIAIEKIERPMTHIIAHESAVKCILLATEIINIFNEIENGGADCRKGDHNLAIPSLWESIGYVFACAKVFIAARKCPRGVIEDVGGMEVIREGWWISIELMRKYRQFSQAASVCVKTLEKLDVLSSGARNGFAGDGVSVTKDISWLECLPIDLNS